jgi:hypothetical protein
MRRALAAVVLTVALVLLVLARGKGAAEVPLAHASARPGAASAPSTPGTPSTGSVATVAVPRDGVPSAPAAASSPLPSREDEMPRARSLRGTDIDGDLERDDRGRFLPTRQAVRLFDYYLSAEGEETDEAIAAHVLAYARRHLGEEESPRAARLFAEYIDYRTSVASRLARDVDAGDVRGAMAVVISAQNAAFGEADAARMFGEDNRIAAAAVARAEALAGQ